MAIALSFSAPAPASAAAPAAADLGHGLKRRHSEVEDPAEDEAATTAATGLKKLRLVPRSTTANASGHAHDIANVHANTANANANALPHSSGCPTSHPAYLQPQQPPSLPSPLHLTHAPHSPTEKKQLAASLSPGRSLIEQNCVNTPPPTTFDSNLSSRASTWGDSMMVDGPAVNIDTPNRVVINDLDAELAEIDAEEAEEQRRREQERLFFLPEGVDKQVSAIPADVLRQATTRRTSSSTSTASTPAPAPAPAPSQALILYKEPPSFGLPRIEADGESESESESKRRLRMAKERIRQRQKEAEASEPGASLRMPTPPTPPPPLPLSSSSWGGQAQLESRVGVDQDVDVDVDVDVDDWPVQDEDAMDIE